LNNALKAGKSLLNLSDNLFLWAQSQSKHLTPVFSKIDLFDIIIHVKQALSNSAKTKNISIVSDIEKGTYVHIDSHMITTVIRNLVNNAIKFTPKNGTIKIESSDKIQTINVYISDTGVGIKDDIANKLFKLDYKHSTQGTNHEIGSGMGLKLCREFVEKNNGKIWIVTKEGTQGSTFAFSMPKFYL